MQFGLPGQPIFPALSNDTILKPTLSWLLQSDRPGNTNAEFSYVTGGMSWHADYNVVAPVSGNLLDIVGWVTLDNQTGKTFPNAHIKLMAGDVNKLQPGIAGGSLRIMRHWQRKRMLSRLPSPSATLTSTISTRLNAPPLCMTAKPSRWSSCAPPACPRSGSTFMTASSWTRTIAAIPWKTFATWKTSASSPIRKIWAMVEFKNSKENHLGMPLPKGRVRFYRRDTDGQMEFTGENLIDHTPSDETIRLYTGNVFDAVGERKRTSYHIDRNAALAG